MDLIAEVCSYYLRGIKIEYSITPLLRLVGKGKNGPILDEVKQNFDWLSGLRDYRHHLVHRLMPTVRNGYISAHEGGKTASALYPVVVPESTPSYLPDTRATRTMDIKAANTIDNNVLPGLVVEKSTVMLQGEDGQEVSALKVNIIPANGYRLIDEFMAEHLDHCATFFSQILHAFEKLNFKPINLKAANTGSSGQRLRR